MGRSGLRWACALGVWWFGSQLAFAQDTPATQDRGADQEARALFMAAQVAFDEGRFESAVQYFLQSYRLSGRPELLYNIGNTYDRLQQQEQALEHFDRYLQQRPDADNRLQVEARVRLLRQAVAAKHAQEQPSPSTPPAPAPTTAAPSPEQTAQAHVAITQPATPATSQAPEGATATQDEGGSSWLLWTGVGAAVVAATIVTVVIATSGSTTQDPLVPQEGAPVVRL